MTSMLSLSLYACVIQRALNLTTIGWCGAIYCHITAISQHHGCGGIDEIELGEIRGDFLMFAIS